MSRIERVHLFQVVPIAFLIACSIRPVIAAGPGDAACEDAFRTANRLIEDSSHSFYADAIRRYKEVMQNCPDFSKGDLVAQNLAYAYLHLTPADPDSAIAVLKNALDRYKDSRHLTDLKISLGDACMMKADFLSGIGRQDDAKPFYTQVAAVLGEVVDQITDSRTKNQVEFDIGNAEFELAHFADACQTYDNLLKQSPVATIAAPALFNQGSAELNMAEATGTTPENRTQCYDRAFGALSTLIQKYPTDPNAIDGKLQLARVLRAQKKPDAAVDVLQGLITSSDRRAACEALDSLAGVYWDQQKYPEALPLLQKYVKDKDHVLQFEADADNVKIGYILRTGKDYTGALDAYRLASTSASPRVAHAALEGQAAVAAAYAREQNYSQAIAIYNALMASTDSLVKDEAEYGRAIAMANTKDPGAKEALAAYLHDHPSSSGANAASFEAGRLQFNAGNFSAALDSFTRASLVAAPTGASISEQNDAASLKSQALHWAGESAQRSGKLEDAVRLWRQELDSDPKAQYDVTVSSLVDLGEYYLGQDDMAQAETFLQQAVDRFSQNAAAAPMVADALLDLGSVAVKLKNYSHAIELYDRVQQVSPKSSAAATARFNAGVAFLKMAPPEYARAVESFEAYLAASPDGPLVDKAWLNEAQAFEMQGVASKDPAALARAQSAYRQVVARTKDNDLAARSLWKIGGIQAQLKQPQEAVATLETAIHKYPNARDIESIVFDKGRILQEARLYDDALVTYRSYLDKFPNSVNAPAVHFNMAVIEYNTGGTQLSKAQDERIAAKSAVLKQAAHDSYVQAASDFEQALTAPSSMAPLRMETREQALYLQGWAYLNSDAPPRALSVFRSLLRDFPNGEHAATAAGRIGILEVSSNPDEAELMLRKCLDSHPKETEAVEPWLAMGQLYQVKGEYDKALPLLAKVIESSAATYDDAAAATYCQGRCYQGQGVKTKARDSYLSVTVDFKDSTEWVDRAKAALKELGPV